MSFPEAFEDDVLSLVSPTPVLLSEIIASLRDDLFHGTPLANGRRWRNVNEERGLRILRDYGAHLATCRHGAGLSIYVVSAPFTTVVNGRGKVVEVYAY